MDCVQEEEVNNNSNEIEKVNVLDVSPTIRIAMVIIDQTRTVVVVVPWTEK